MSNAGEVRKLKPYVESVPGWVWDDETNGGHIAVRYYGKRIMSFSRTPSDFRAVRKITSTLRRHGFDIPHKNHKKKENR